MKTLATVVLTAILTSAFWIFAFGISRGAPPAAGGGDARVDGKVEGKGDATTVRSAAGSASLSVAESVVVGPSGLAIPVAGITANQLTDTFTAARAGGARRHDAIDIIAPEGTPVFATAPGTIEKLYYSLGAGGITAYERSEDGRWMYYYAHLSAYAPGIAEGQKLQRGSPIGRVGHSGDASPDGPHLHFAINQMAPGEKWWNGTPINPYPLLAGKAATR